MYTYVSIYIYIYIYIWIYVCIMYHIMCYYVPLCVCTYGVFVQTSTSFLTLTFCLPRTGPETAANHMKSLVSVKKSSQDPCWCESLKFLGNDIPLYIIYSRIYPICSMYGIFTYIWVIFRADVGKYSIHGAYGYITNYDYP